jgi:gliding motility-associated-like protein
MTQKDNIKELFAKGLQDHHISVDPALWSSISSSISAGSAKAGLGILTKVLIGVAASSMVGVAVYLTVQTTQTEPKKINQEQKFNTPQPNKNPSRSIQTESSIKSSTTNQTIVEVNIPPIDDSALENQPAQNQVVSIQDAIKQPHVLQDHLLSNSVVPVPTQNPTPAQSQSANTQPTTPTNTQNQVVNQGQQTEKPIRIALPNVFTPNGDGKNETLQIDWNEFEVLDFSIVVLDTKNNVVFKNNDPNFQWNGTNLGGEKLAAGYYIYFVTGLLNEQQWQQSSSLQIQY